MGSDRGTALDKIGVSSALQIGGLAQCLKLSKMANRVTSLADSCGSCRFEHEAYTSVILENVADPCYTGSNSFFMFITCLSHVMLSQYPEPVVGCRSPMCELAVKMAHPLAQVADVVGHSFWYYAGCGQTMGILSMPRCQTSSDLQVST